MLRVGETVIRTCVKCGQEFPYEYKGGKLRDLHPETGKGATGCRRAKSNEDRTEREKRIRKKTIEARVAVEVRAGVAERMRELFPPSGYVHDSTVQRVRIPGDSFMLGLPEDKHAKLLVRLHEASAAGYSLLKESKSERNAQHALGRFRYEMQTRFLPLLFAVTDLFEE